MVIRVAILTVSDRCSQGLAEDVSGRILKELVAKDGNKTLSRYGLVPDDKDKIQKTLIQWTDSLDRTDIIITTGGTGFSPRDITPEATKEILDREAPGIVVALLQESIKITPFAMTSRLAAGTRKSTMIVNFPGSPKAVAECFSILQPVLNHCIDQLKGDVTAVDNHHTNHSNNKNHLNNKNHRPIPASRTSTSTSSLSSNNSLPPSSVVISVSQGNTAPAAIPPALRDRESSFPMIEADMALEIVLKEVTACLSSSTELIPIHDLKHLIHRVLAVDLKSNVNIPPFPASVKDGYAVLTIDGGGNTRTVLPAPSTAGTLPSTRVSVTSGYCVRISTGAPVPVGTDAVVQVEDTQLVSTTDTGEEQEIFIKKKPSFGQDIRSVGCDVKKGEVVLKEGTVLRPVELALISSIGFADVPVVRLPTIGLLSTGDEIIPAGQVTASSGKIWDANKTCLASLLISRNIDYVDLGIAKDDPEDVYSKLVQAFDNDIDVLITTGGVSMGEKDVLKRILEVGFEARIHFGRVNIKPGKPFSLITCDWKGVKKVIFALPGNPVSAFVTCFLFVLPSLKISFNKEANNTISLKGYHKRMTATIKTYGKIINLDSRPEFSRGILTFSDLTPEVELIRGGQASSRLLSVRDANVLIEFPMKSSERSQVYDGETVTVILMD